MAGTSMRALLLIAVLGGPSPVFAASADTFEALLPPALPDAVQAALVALAPRHPGRLPARLDPELRETCTSAAYPYLVQGDFDGDARTDLAFWWLSPEPHGATLWLYESRRARLVPLWHARSHESRLPPLVLHPRGSAVYDFDRDRLLTLDRDAPGAMLCWKSATAWVREADGRYRELLTSD
jgi:hypothetical protein